MKKIIGAFILVGFILALAAPAYAAGPLLDGKIVVGEDFTLKNGETIQGDLVVISGSATVESGARVNGNVVVMGGSADIAGRVSQNMTVMGGDVTLRSSAEIDERLAVLGGSITREEGAQVKGGESQGFGSDGNWDFPRSRVSPMNGFDLLLWLVQSIIQALVMVGVVSVLALVIGALWPEQTTRVSAAIATAPAVSGLLGLLTLVAVPIVLVVVLLTICLAPVSIFGLVAYVAAILFGWVALGLLLGNRLAAAFKWNLPPAGAAALGTLIVSGLAAPLWFIPPLQCIGIPLDIILASLGLGGVVLTRVGTTPYLSGAAFAPRPPAVPQPPAPLPPMPPEPPAPPAPIDLTLFAQEPAPMPEAPAAPEPEVNAPPVMHDQTQFTPAPPPEEPPAN